MRTDMVHSYLRDLIHQVTGNLADSNSDGDLIVEHDGALLRARVLNPVDPVIQVSTTAVDDLAESPDLCTRINAINSEIGFARAYWIPTALLIESEIWASDVNPGNFEFAVINVAAATNRHAPGVINEFGGTRPIARSDLGLQLESSSGSITSEGGYL